MFQPLTFESCFQFPADDAAGFIVPDSGTQALPEFTLLSLLSCISQSELITVLTTGLVYCGSYTPSGMPGAKHADSAYQLIHVDKV